MNGGFDGQKQRNALTALEQAIRARAAGNRDRSIANATKAEKLDQIGVYAGVAAVITKEDPWQSLRDLLPPGPLHALIDTVDPDV